MAINRKYKQGAEDIGHLAGKALESVADRIETCSDEIERALTKQGYINNAVFDMLDEDAIRLKILEIGYRPVDMRMIYSFSPDIKATMARLILSIPCDNKSKKYQMLLLARLGVSPLSNDKRIPLKDEAAEAMATILLKLSAIDNSDDTQSAIEQALDNLILSRRDLKRIATQISELSGCLQDSFHEFVIRELDDPESFTNPIIKTSKVKHKIKGIVVGKTASGKSTLLNSIFEYEQTTKLSTEIEKSGFTLFADKSGQVSLYDTPGLKLGDQRELVKKIEQLISNESINVLLYCVNCTSFRFEEFEAELVSRIRNLSLSLSVYVVLTNCYQPDSDETLELIKYIQSHTNHIQVMPVLAKRKNITVDYIEPYGLKELIEVIAYE